MDALDCLETLGISEKFNGFTEECQERCFLALRQLQKWKVKHFYKVYKMYAYSINIKHFVYTIA